MNISSITSLPTDNVYKFISVFGLIMLISSFYFKDKSTMNLMSSEEEYIDILINSSEWQFKRELDSIKNRMRDSLMYSRNRNYSINYQNNDSNFEDYWERIQDSIRFNEGLRRVFVFDSLKIHSKYEFLKREKNTK